TSRTNQAEMPDTLLDEPAPNGPMPPRLPGVSTICCLLPSARTELQDYTWMTIESRRRGAQSRRNILARSEVAGAMRLRVRKRSKRAVFIYSMRDGEWTCAPDTGLPSRCRSALHVTAQSAF